MRNKVKLIATAAVAAGAVSLGATALAGLTLPGDPRDEFFDALPRICRTGVIAIEDLIPNPAGPAANYAANAGGCLVSSAAAG